MAKVNTNEELLENAELQTKSFFTKHSKTIIGTFIAVVVIAMGIALWQLAWVKPLEREAQVTLFKAQSAFESQTADYAALLVEFENVAANYGSTPAGNEAHFYAAACALRTGDVEKASQNIEAFDEMDGEMGAAVNALAIVLKGDIAVEKQQIAEAVALYEEAAETVNAYSAPMALLKAARCYIALGEGEKAQVALKKIVENYGSSAQALEAQKMMK
jgi:predicted negative regulator of RcsB-dependent stress response